MSIELFINETALETRLALKTNNDVDELYIGRHASPSLVGNIYYGKVVRVLSGIQSAFVDIGLDKNAWLNLDDVEPQIKHQSSTNKPVITDLLRQGQMIEVQVLKDALGDKGVQVSTRISLASRHLVFTPYISNISISKRIRSDALKQQLINLLKPYSDDKSGFVIRTQARSCEQTQLIKEAQWLKSQWQIIKDGFKNQAKAKLKPQCVYQDLPLALRFIRDELNENITQIHLDDSELHQSILEFSQQCWASLADKLTLHPRPSNTALNDAPQVSLFESQGIELAIEQALLAQVPLTSGGYLIIEQTEAMTTIDINTGSFIGDKSIDQTVLAINLEAIKEAAKQIRLRQLSGMILIDCIGTMNASQQKLVKKTLEQALKLDRTKTKVYGFTALGLLEMTRQRSRHSLEQTLSIRCPICEGNGCINSMETAASHLIRELQYLADQYMNAQLIICTSTQFSEWLKMNDVLNLALKSLNKRISIRVASMDHPTQFNIVME